MKDMQSRRHRKRKNGNKSLNVSFEKLPELKVQRNPNSYLSFEKTISANRRSMVEINEPVLDLKRNQEKISEAGIRSRYQM